MFFVRVFTFIVTDNVNSSLPATVALDLRPVNDPPVLDLSGPRAGLNFSTTYVEDGVPILAFSPLLSIFDVVNNF